MDRNLTPDVQNLHTAEIIAVGSSALSSAIPLLDHYPSLKRLCELVFSNSLNASINERLIGSVGLEQFEMLEAELCNQRILSGSNSELFHKLSQLAAHEANFWRWKARRHGLASVSINVTIDIPKYLCSRVVTLVSIVFPDAKDELKIENLKTPTDRYSSASKPIDDVRTAQQELRYLDTFGAYLLGEFDLAEHPFQRGLNLLLKSLAFNRAAADALARAAGGEDAKPFEIQLPVNTPQFLDAIVSYRTQLRKD